jgi:hypothetical protein
MNEFKVVPFGFIMPFDTSMLLILKRLAATKAAEYK